MFLLPHHNLFFYRYFAESSSRHECFNQRDHSSVRIYELNDGHYSSYVDFEVNDASSSMSDLSHLNSVAIAQRRYPNHCGTNQERNNQNSGKGILLEIEVINEYPFKASTETKQVNCCSFYAACCICCVVQ